MSYLQVTALMALLYPVACYVTVMCLRSSVPPCSPITLQPQ